MPDYQQRPNRGKDEFAREFDRTDHTLSLRDQLKKWGTAEEKLWIAKLEKRESDSAERKKMQGIETQEKYNIVPNFSKHDVKRDW
jgi:hypothetical protein